MNRIAALAEIIRNANADAMLLTGEVNLMYALQATALEGECLILADGSAIFVTDGRYTEAAEALLLPRGFQVLTRVNTVGLYDYLRALLEERGIKNLMYEDDVLTVDQFAYIREKFSCSFQPIGRSILALRARKSEEEIACIITAQRIAEQALEQLLPELYTGMTEREAAARLNYYMALGGSEKPSFDTILLFGESTSRPHGVPGDRKLQPGDFVLADFGAVFHGYHSDMTRTFAYGSATEEMRKVYGTGEYFTHALGHSVGLEIHEMPVAAPRCDDVLCNGIVITDEPGIYIAGKFGVRIEDMLVISGDSAVTLTKFPRELTVLPVHA